MVADTTNLWRELEPGDKLTVITTRDTLVLSDTRLEKDSSAQIAYRTNSTTLQVQWAEGRRRLTRSIPLHSLVHMTHEDELG